MYYQNYILKYQNDFEVKEVSKYGTVKGDLYKKMAITLSLYTFSSSCGSFMDANYEPLNQSDAESYTLCNFQEKCMMKETL